MKAEFAADDAGALHHSPVSQTPPERMTMDRMQVDCVFGTVGGSFIARRFTPQPMALDSSDAPEMSRYDAGV